MKKIILVLLCMCSYVLYAQEKDTASQKRLNNIYSVEIGENTTRVIRKDIAPVNSLVFGIGVGIPVVTNDLLKKDFWNTKTGFTIQPEICFRRQILKEQIQHERLRKVPTAVAIGGGIGFSYFKKSIYFDRHSETLNSIYDNDDMNYNANLSYRSVEESVSIGYLDIPLFVEFGKPSQTKITGWAQVGVKTSFLVFDKFSGSGYYTATGYYPEWSVELENIPELGFYNNQNCYKDVEYKLSPVVLWGSISGGISFPFSNSDKDMLSKFILKIGGKIDYSLTKISKDLSDPFFTGASYRINQSNLLGSNGSRMLSLKLEINLIYRL